MSGGLFSSAKIVFVVSRLDTGLDVKGGHLQPLNIACLAASTCGHIIWNALCMSTVAQPAGVSAALAAVGGRQCMCCHHKLWTVVHRGVFHSPGRDSGPLARPRKLFLVSRVGQIGPDCENLAPGLERSL